MDWHASGAGGAVAAGGEGAVAAGIAQLQQGGNAVDAAVATLLALSVTDYGSFAIGGEIPLLLWDAKRKRVQAFSGVGTAPMSPEAMAWYTEHGIPAKGGVRATPVPGALHLCLTVLLMRGTRSFADVAAPTLGLLAAGTEAWHEALARTLEKLADTERRTTGMREDKILAARDRAYAGDVADALEAFYVREGSFLHKRDLAAHVTRVEDPVSVAYRGYRVYKCGPWTQGPSLCQALRLLEGFDLRGAGHLSAGCIHVAVEALKLAFADRDAHYGDPRFVDVPLEELFSDAYTRLRRELIDPDHASMDLRPGDPRGMRPLLDRDGPSGLGPGGTTTCVASDRWGNVVAATPSANRPYAICEALGIAHGNRLRSLNTHPRHPNRIEPGKRPRVTLTPTLVTHPDGRVLAVSVAGGDLQEQATLNCLLNHIEFGMMPREAVSAPRFSTSHHENSFRPHADRKEAVVARGLVKLDARVAADVERELAARGHTVDRVQRAIGTPVMLVLDGASGTAHAAGDPLAGRHAQALG